MKWWLLSILVLVIPLMSHADWRDKTLSQLLTEYQTLPTVKNENLLEGIMNNVLIQDIMAQSTEGLGPELEKLNYGAAEINVLKKQALAGLIFKAGILEIRDLEMLNHLLLRGEYAGVEGLKSIDRIASIETIFDVLYLLLQRPEEGAKEMALTILMLKGPVYPSTDSFARGLARYAAVSAVNRDKFTRILELFDDLYAVLDRHPESPPGAYREYFIGSISRELTEPAYNPAYAEPQARAQIINNVFEQIRLRDSELEFQTARVRADLLQGLAQVTDNAETDRFVQRILETSTNDLELRTVLLGLAGRKDRRAFELIYNSIDRMQNLPAPADKQRLVEVAVQYFIYPFSMLYRVSSELDELLISLYAHPNPRVRRAALDSLGWQGFDQSYSQELLFKFLSDESDLVRFRALDFVSAKVRWYKKLDYVQRLREMAESDPDEGVRKYAFELIPELIESYNVLKARDDERAKTECAEILRN